MMRVVLDTNILVYSINTKSDLYNSARSKLQELIDNNIKIILPDKVIYELYRVISSKAFSKYINKSQIYNIWAYFAFSKNFEMACATESTLYILDKMIKKFPDKNIFDLLILSIAIENEVEIIYTRNIKDFPLVEYTRVVNPFI